MSIRAQFERTCRFLDLGGNHGAIFNPHKFQFCQKKVTYVGLVLDESGVRPPDDFFEAIRSFPTPVNVTDIRAWFGMVAQVAYTFSELPIMEPFWHLLSTKHRLHGPQSSRQHWMHHRKRSSKHVW